MYNPRKDNNTLRLNLLKHIVRCPLFRSKGRQHSFLLFTSAILILSMLVGCGPRTEDLEAVEYTPLPGDGWEVSTPAEQGLDPMLVAIPIEPPTKGTIKPLAETNIDYVWANDGGDKVTQDEMRAAGDAGSVLNSIWNGGEITLFGAKNEVISFNLVLEAPKGDAVGVEVDFTELLGPDGAAISTRPARGEDVFNYVGRNIELFYTRYLEIRGLSIDLAYNDYDERHIPERCRGPFDPETGEGFGTWNDRPCRNKFYPDIAVPLELHTPFTIDDGRNQSIWGDIYIPKEIPPGEYLGFISIAEDSIQTWEIPVKLQVLDFNLPDIPSAKTMLQLGMDSANDRYFGNQYPSEDSDNYQRSTLLADRHFQLAHRHKISMIDNGETPVDRMGEVWGDRLTGDLFTPARGYDGVGVGVGNNVYSIGTYGSWDWKEDGKRAMWENTDPWVEWFESLKFRVDTDYFLYLIDESDDYRQTERWAKWMDENPGPGQRLMSMATIQLPEAVEYTPSLDVLTGGVWVSDTGPWQNAVDRIKADPSKLLYMYNGHRPVSGSFALEDDGIALRELAWGHFKFQVERWFYWQSTYYINFDCYGYEDPLAYINLFQQAQGFGCYEGNDDVLGETGWNYFNGDGVMFYPGTDVYYPEESYDLLGPFASLRLKHWRRGIQDVDYLTLAAQIDPQRTEEIVNAMVPRILWEVGVEDPEDPTWVLTDISWSTDPDVWEAARAALAEIILPSK